MKAAPQSSITSFFGYNGKVIPKTEEMMALAYQWCSNVWLIMGILFTALSIFVFRISPADMKLWFFIILLLIQGGFLVGTIVKIELKLISMFHKDGTRKEA